nr:MAG TPA: hypothetical protein [Caudoviricetes sp.]
MDCSELLDYACLKYKRGRFLLLNFKSFLIAFITSVKYLSCLSLALHSST